MKDSRKKLMIPLIAVGLGLVLGIVVILITGRNPLIMFGAMLQVLTGIDLFMGAFSPRYIGELVVQMMPIVLTGLSVGFAFKAGLFNIGAEGQLMMGSLAATVVALALPLPAGIHLPVAILAGMCAGALWGAIPGFLKAKFNVHEVVVTIMMNYTALFFNTWCLINAVGTLDKIKTDKFPESAVLKDEFLAMISGRSRLNWGFVIVVVAILAYWFVINKTPFGYSLRAVGFNKDGAKYAGMKVDRNIVLSMTIAGAFAGLAGTVLTLGTFGYGRVLSAQEGYGFDGIAIALVGSNSAVGILLSGLLFGVLKSAGPLMQSHGIPKEIAGIIQASIVLFVAMSNGIKYLMERFSASRSKPGEVDVLALEGVAEVNAPDDEGPPGGGKTGEAGKGGGK